MPADVHINDVTTDINVTDASAMLTQKIMERIIKPVLKRLDERQRTEREIAQERSLGAMRQQETDIL